MKATMKKPAINLFAAPAVKETAKKGTDKKLFAVPVLDDKIQRFNLLKEQIEAATGELKMIEGDIKTVGREQFLKQYRNEKMRPDNFKLQDATGASALFICMDKYTLVDENKAEILNQFEGLVDEKLTYTLNPELVEKYATVISGLIIGCKEISEEDKTQLIKGELQYSVKKGSIDRLMQYPEMEQVFELINPICALKK